MEAAFFDLDKTIIARSGPLALGRSFVRAGLVPPSFLLKSFYAQLIFQLMGADENKMERMRLAAAELTKGWEQAKVRETVDEVLEKVISPLIYAEAAALIEEHHAAARLVCLVSSSPQEIVEPMASLLGADRWIATKPRIVDGFYTGELEFYAFGSRKADAVRALATEEGIELEGSYAYSDSITDLPLLEMVGHPVAVNPDKELRGVAMRREWELAVFHNPVTLRSRLPHVSDAGISAGVAAAGVVGAAAVAFAARRWVNSRSA